MNVATHSMDPRIANIHYKDYRKKVREHRRQRLEQAAKDIAEGGKRFRAGRTARSTIEQEDMVLMASYRALAKGQRILNLIQVMNAMELDKAGLPTLAIAGASWERCHLSHFSGQIVFGPNPWPYRLRGKYEGGAIGFEAHVFKDRLTNKVWRVQHQLPLLPVSALVPAIPAMLRPTGDLKGYHILWEPVWEPNKAPEDPILLKHIGGAMYAILAQWDLTPIEQAVLAGRV